MGQVVGKEGKTRQRVQFAGQSGAWADMEQSVNTLIDDLLWPTTEVTRALAAVAQGDLSQTMRLDVDGRPLQGEFLRSATIVNSMIKQLGVFTSEVTRVAREVGTDGKLGGQADVPDVSGVWKDLTESRELDGQRTSPAQVRNISEVTIAVASGDLSQEDHRRRPRRDPPAEGGHQHHGRPAPLLRLRGDPRGARGRHRGKLGGQAIVPGVAGTWKDLTDSVNAMCGNLTDQVRNIAQVTTAVARGDLSRKITVDVRGEILELKDTINTMVDQLNSFASEVTRVAREVGTDGKLGGQAQVPGVGGTWKDLTDSVNFMASNLTAQVRNIAEVATAIASGDLSRKITVNVSRRDPPAEGDHQHHGRPAQRLRRGGDPGGARGRHRGAAGRPGAGARRGRHLEGPHRQRELHGRNLTGQVRNIAEVATAIASGDLSKKITVDVSGEILQLKQTINTMVDQLNAFAGEVTRVAREVGTEGKLGGQAVVRGVAGTWKDLTDSVNSMASNLTGQVRNIAEVATAVARGDLSKKITVDVKGEILQLKETMNTMVDQLNAFAAEVTRVAREVGTDGKLGGQAEVPGVGGTWKDLTDTVNSMAANLTGQVRNIAEVATAIAGGDLSRKITVDVRGEILQLKETINTMVDQLNAFAGEVTRVAREVGTEGRLGGQAQVPGRRRHLEGAHRQRELHGRQPHRPGAQHRRGDDGRRPRRPVPEDHRRREGRDPRAEEHHQHDGGPAERLRLRGDPRRPRRRHRGEAGRPGRGPGRRRHLEGPHRQRQLDGEEPHRPGAQHRRGRDGHRQRRPVEEDHRRRPRRAPGAQGDAEHHGGAAPLLRRRGDPRRPRGGHRGPPRRSGQRARRGRHLEGPHRQREPPRRQPHHPGAQHRRGDHRRRPGRPLARRSPSTSRARSSS